ncbi:MULTISPECIES: ABC transporter ATP-binding protein/permease [unclassified Prochlorococcus]|uniref:ABC transporter ATP-binding protein/permease n=1 Tax=unclassified Prochlorococcus TaxID=2627481 RepID=UPI0005338757|nr:MULTISPECIES: ABC transporter ATP-binding protein/permease [unclassified Prochlorococcus]KGG16875.1 ATP-binding protein of ABC transporter [Prochlorococcus sp. MIT 0602]KGG18151.1 ATP-binding protein of ABC transporter [Prochlorococcus sp. MIT 0603]
MTEQSISNHKTLKDQLGSLRKLAQPFFLPLEHNSGWTFIWLLISLLFCVGGIVLILLTGLIELFEKIQPILLEKYFGGVVGIVDSIWSSWWGVFFIGIFLIGSISFFNYRHELRNKKWIHWSFLGIIVIMLLAVNGINAGIGFIARDLTNALVEKQESGFYKILWIYAFCFIVALPIRVSQIFFTYKLGLIWREWLSKSLISDYMKNKAYYILNPNDEEETDVDNPDQRITDDTRAFTGQSLSFTLGIFDALLTFSLNIIILWTISKTLTLSLFTYAAFATSILLIAGKNLVRIDFDQLRYEADFRYGLVHIRDNAESIAFYSGEKPEKAETQRRLSEVVDNFNLLIIWRVIIDVMRRSINYAGNFFPYLIMAIPYFAGEIDYGRFIQASFAFGMVEGSLFFVVNQIEELAKFTAGISRLEGFQSKVEKVSNQIIPNQNDLELASDSIIIKNADLNPPGSDKQIILDLSLNINQNDSLLVVGPSGCGKTSLLRMISGLWKPSNGNIDRPKQGDLLFIPQKPYMLLGSLREQLCYPTDQSKFSDDHLRSVLKEVNLASLIDRYPDLTIKQDWPRILSLGEQQRLAFGRLLLNSPRFAVLDEATSALDINTEEHLYSLLKKRDLAVISVGHRPTLLDFHESVLELTGNGSWRLQPSSSYAFEKKS